MTAHRYHHPQGNVFYRKMSHPRPMVSHGDGIYLYDLQGNRYIDGSGGPLVVNVGHGRREVIEAINRQMSAVAYVHATMFTSDALEHYAQALAEKLPITDARIYLLSSGSEAVEGALKLARQIQLARGERRRHLIISRHQSYHGMTLGALSVSGRPGLRNPYLEMMVSMPQIDPPYPYRDTVSGEEAADRLEQAVLENGPEMVAAFIAEPISGASLGAVVPPNDYWPRIREICDRYGLLLIVDEVLVGFGRTGKWWGIDHWQVEPDILVSSKGAAGGYFPLGFFAVQGALVQEIADKFGDFNHGGTFSHHAVGAAAGLAVIEILEKERLVDNSARMGAILGAKLKAFLGDHPNVGDIRGRGLFWALELVKNKETKEPFPHEKKAASNVWNQAFSKGLIVYTSQGCANGKDGDLILIGPPLVINESQIDEAVGILFDSLVGSF